MASPSVPFRATHFALPALVILQVACGGGDSAGPGPRAATIEANSSTTITAPAGSSALELPSVIVRDENGTAIRGARVSFAVTGGDGSITGANATTNGQGVATVGEWKLGQTATTNTVSATVEGLPSVTFTANAGNPCQVSAVHSFGTADSGKLSPADCQVSDGSFVDFWTINIPTAGTYLLNETSTQFDSYLLLLTPDFHVIAQNDNAGVSTRNSTIKAILPAGSFLVGANSLNPRQTGSYAISSNATTNPVTNCEDVFVVPGITTDQSLQTSDCVANGLYSDDFVIFLNTGQSITVTMTSSSIDSYLELYEIRVGGGLVAANDDIDGTTKDASLTFTAQSFGYFFIKARTPSTGTTGGYTLTIQ